MTLMFKMEHFPFSNSNVTRLYKNRSKLNEEVQIACVEGISVSNPTFDHQS